MLVSWLKDGGEAREAQNLTFFLERGYVGQLAYGVAGVVDLQHNLLVSIGQQQQRHLQHGVVAAGLVADALRDGDVVFFAFDDHERAAVGVVDHDVAAAAHAVEGYRAFDLHEFEGVAEEVVQAHDGVLSDPLFWGEGHPSASRGVEDLAAAAIVAGGGASIWSFRRHLRRRPSVAGAV